MKYLTAGALVALLSTASANAASNYTASTQQAPMYFSISGDLMWVHDSDVSGGTGGTAKFDLGGGGNLAVGYENLDYSGLRGEIEVGYHSADLKDTGGTLRMGTLMANLYYDFPSSYQFTPYIGAGIGDSWLTLSRSSGLGNTDNSDNEFAYQGMIGISLTPDAMPSTKWSLGYHYLGFYKPQFDNIELDYINTSSIELGVRYHF